MDFTQGERVNLDLGPDNHDGPESRKDPPAPALIPTAFVGDILERAPSANPPVAPSLPKSHVNGFPAHKKRQPRVSAFKQQQAAKEDQAARATQADAAPVQQTGADTNDERRGIDEENRTRLAAMSEAEIEQEREELLSSLSPSLIQKLLGRANLNEGSNERNLFEEKPMDPTPPTDDINKTDSKQPSAKKVTFAAPKAETGGSAHQSEAAEATAIQTQEITEAELSAKAFSEESEGSIHFPKIPQPPDLDPDDPSFLKNLHEKYFPNLAYDPSSLSWMAPIDPADKSSPYHPSQTALNPNELRFDFKGNLLAPSVAREIPVTKGLHHHADAPEAAGYTIPELSILSRSAVAAQRCMAYQTLGRILYRLGQGEYGVEKPRQETDGPVKVATNPDKEEDDEDDVGDAMAAGLWNCVEEGRVIETLTEEATKEKGHLTARTFAQEALWNWRRGGGRKRHAV